MAAKAYNKQTQISTDYCFVFCAAFMLSEKVFQVYYLCTIVNFVHIKMPHLLAPGVDSLFLGHT